MNVTDKGKRWELFNSLWVFWTFVNLGFISFFWIGVRAKQKKWILFGWVYLIFGFAPFVIATEIPDLVTVLMSISTITCIASIAHAFIIRKAYLVHREYILENTTDATLELRNKLRGQNPIPKQIDHHKSKALHENKENQILTSAYSEALTKSIASSIDLNTCTEQELSTLPGIGIARAKKALMIRSQKGSFATVDDFTESLNIEPHFTIQIKKLATVSEPTQKISESYKEGRTVDI